jgi:activating signal cointegrator 1
MKTKIKALTISQPYASLIASGEKWVENRRWSTNYTGPLAIHAGKGMQYLDREELAEYPTGCIVATTQLVCCLQRATILRYADSMKFNHCPVGFPHTWEELAEHEHCEGPYCWLLADVRKVDVPVQYRGAQGLFEVDIDADS